MRLPRITRKTGRWILSVVAVAILLIILVAFVSYGPRRISKRAGRTGLTIDDGAVLPVSSVLGPRVIPEYRDIRVGGVTGRVTVKSGSAGIAELTPGATALAQGDVITTSNGSYATIVIDNDTEVSLDQNSVLELTTVSINGSAKSFVTVLSLYDGNVLSNVRVPLEAQDVYEVHTPTSAMAISGTIVHVGYDKTDESSEIAFLTGHGLAFIKETDTSFKIYAGERVRQNADGYILEKLDPNTLPAYISRALDNFDEIRRNIETIDFRSLYSNDEFTGGNYTIVRDIPVNNAVTERRAEPQEETPPEPEPEPEPVPVPVPVPEPVPESVVTPVAPPSSSSTAPEREIQPEPEYIAPERETQPEPEYTPPARERQPEPEYIPPARERQPEPEYTPPERETQPEPEPEPPAREVEPEPEDS